jgi:L-fuculose-phosphate aldolase
VADFDFEQLGRDFRDGVVGAANSVADAARQVGDDAGRYKAFMQVGRYLGAHGLISTHGGNLSASDGKKVWITKTGAMLGSLVPGEIVTCALDDAVLNPKASRELPVHKAVYEALFSDPVGDAQLDEAYAIVHAHPIAAIAYSLNNDSLRPLDSEGAYLLGTEVPVFAPEQTIASEEVTKLLAGHVAGGGRCAIVRGHGSFAVAKTLELALQLTVAIDRSAAIARLA